MKLIQLSTVELENRVEEELSENPALEDGKINDIEKAWTNKDSIINELEFQDKDMNLDQYMSDDEIPNYKLYSQNSTSDEEQNYFLTTGKNLIEILMDQLREQI